MYFSLNCLTLGNNLILKLSIAHEILSDPIKRRQFDSVDESIDDNPPSLKAKGNFFEIYGPVFERESR
jgi:DnaJ homolog subfamily C member 2